METKSTPPAVVLSLIVLFLIAMCGVAGVSLRLGLWRVNGTGLFPYHLIGPTLMFCIAPVIAIIDVAGRRSFGRYLAILSMLCSWAAVLSSITSVLGVRLMHNASDLLFFPIFGIVVWLPVLVYFLGFNKRVDVYFGSELHT